MKNLSLFATLAFVVILAGCSHVDPEAPTSSLEDMVEQPPVVDTADDANKDTAAEDDFLVETADIFAGIDSIDLVDVAGGNAAGQAWVLIEKDGSTEHRVVASDLPELTNGDFYEGWLVRDPASLGFISTGEMVFDEEANQWVLNYSSETDYSDYPGVVITLEPDDGDPAPAAHVLDGSF